MTKEMVMRKFAIKSIVFGYSFSWNRLYF